MTTSKGLLANDRKVISNKGRKSIRQFVATTKIIRTLFLTIIMFTKRQNKSVNPIHHSEFRLVEFQINSLCIDDLSIEYERISSL